MRNRALLLAALLATLVVGAIPAHASPSQATSTPIKHLVVIFQENVSFDHYFGTYPNAANPAGEPLHGGVRHTQRQRTERRPAHDESEPAIPSGWTAPRR